MEDIIMMEQQLIDLNKVIKVKNVEQLYNKYSITSKNLEQQDWQITKTKKHHTDK